ncbi:hypothetical protein ACFONC_03240 [Luteimonas soli]|uniref:Uncharacterized protein n=1 Tax=Luteimonas soli TaxID=1648966 RepID=A0ABV7XIP1_9GAMM
MHYTYDRSQALSLALIATGDLREIRYVPLLGAPPTARAIARPYLRQLHTVAGGELCGLTVRTWLAYRAEQWAGC